MAGFGAPAHGRARALSRACAAGLLLQYPLVLLAMPVLIGLTVHRTA